MTTTPLKKFTFEEYLTYDDGTDNRYELVDGDLLPMTPASPEHSDIVHFLYIQFYHEIKRLNRDWKVKLGDTGVRTQVKRSRLPDVCVIDGKDWRSLKGSAKSAILQVPTLLAVEVVSLESVSRDYEDKLDEYASIGTPEYWIVDPIDKKVSVLLLVNGSYLLTEFTGSQQIISRTFPELTLTVEQVLSA